MAFWEKSVLVGWLWPGGIWPGLSVDNYVQNPRSGQPCTECPWTTDSGMDRCFLLVDPQKYVLDPSQHAGERASGASYAQVQNLQYYYVWERGHSCTSIYVASAMVL